MLTAGTVDLISRVEILRAEGCKMVFEVRFMLITKIQFCIAFFVSLNTEISAEDWILT
jgi:hypothetical protein